MPRVRRCRYKDCHAMVELPDHYCQRHYSYEAEYIANRQNTTLCVWHDPYRYHSVMWNI